MVSANAIVPNLLTVGGSLIEFVVTTFPLNLAVVVMVVGAVVGVIVKTKKTTN
ncbi:MAG TPA: hypothetical protein VJ845_00515 [Haploplasma sp.]|nr:hypothetical protein [Haploplasma sp.]